ncbi:MAG: hypothetical protein HRU75_00185 [Planctomycetia bacterium]|nr:MAG: hypothetical protein HRU75_00185 [Planctomycetia bacterium]
MKRSAHILASVTALFGLAAGTGCNLQQAATDLIADTVSQGISQGVNNSGGNVAGIDVQALIDQYSN